MDYSRFLYKPFDKKTVDTLEKQYPEFRFKVPDKQKAIDYLLLMYDIASGEVKTYSDRLYERKKYAATKAGFTLNKKGEFDEWIEDIIIGENEQFNDAVVRFVRMFGLPDLPTLVAYNEMIDHEFSSSAKVKDHAMIKTIIQNIEGLRTKIEQLERKIFSGEETENVRKSLYRLMEKQRLGLRPEEKAVEIAENRVNVDDPYYGKD